MRDYELILITHPELEESAFNEAITRVQGWITEANGEITKTELWGKRKLAYPIRKLTEGYYVFMNIKMDPKFSATLDRNLRFLEPVIRYLVVAKDE